VSLCSLDPFSLPSSHGSCALPSSSADSTLATSSQSIHSLLRTVSFAFTCTQHKVLVLCFFCLRASSDS